MGRRGVMRMTPDDANKLLALAKANYSYAFKNMTKQEKVMLVQSWAFALQDIPADIVMLAFMQLLTTSKWLPTVAEIREKVKELHYESTYSTSLFPDQPEVQKAKEYIAAHTYRLRGDDNSHELSLDQILQGPYTASLGSGKMGFSAIEEGQTMYPPDKEDEQ